MMNEAEVVLDISRVRAVIMEVVPEDMLHIEPVVIERLDVLPDHITRLRFLRTDTAVRRAGPADFGEPPRLAGFGLNVFEVRQINLLVIPVVQTVGQRVGMERERIGIGRAALIEKLVEPDEIEVRSRAV